MARDVEFRLAVVRDPQSKSRAKEFERDVTKIQSDHQRKRTENRKKTEREIGVERRNFLTKERDTSKKALLAHKDSLDKRFRAYKVFVDKSSQQAEKGLQDFKRIENQKRIEFKKTLSAGQGRPGGADLGGRASGGGIGAIGAGAIGGRLAGMGSAALGATGVTLGAAAVVAGGRAAIGAQSELEQQHLRMEAMTGSARDAARAVEMLSSVSSRIGLPREEVENITSLLFNYGMSLDEAVERTTQLAGVTGGSANEMFRIAEALGEASRFGKITEETLKKMESSGFSPLLAISQKTGESLASLTKRAQEGDLAFSEMTKTLDEISGTTGGYNENVGRLSETTRSKLQSAKNEWKDLAATIGEVLVATRLIEAGGSIAEVGNFVGRNYSAALTGQSVQRAQEIELEKARRARAGETTFGIPVEASDIALRALDLNEQIAKLQDRRQKAQQRHEEQQRQREERRKELAQERLQTGSKEIVQARQLNKLRLDGAREELETRKQALTAAKDATREAKQGLMSAQERFGAMSTQEQRQVLDVLQKARRDVRSLGVDDIQQLQSLGTREASSLSSRALRFRATAAFGDRAMTPEQEQRRRQLRASVFAGERQAVRQAEQRETRVEANVEQQIKFVAKYEQNAKQIADRVMELYREANKQQMDEVIQMLQPIQQEIATMRRRQQAQAPGRGF